MGQRHDQAGGSGSKKELNNREGTAPSGVLSAGALLGCGWRCRPTLHGMFLIRQSKPEDASTLLKLARTVYFINLPPNEQLIAGKIADSTRCFRELSTELGAASSAALNSGAGSGRDKKLPDTKPVKKSKSSGGGAYGHRDLFMFSILDADGGGVIGTSQIVSRMGGPGDPNWAMKVTEKKFYSESLRYGCTHSVGQLYGDESGPSEIGGLILDPGFRGHRQRPGRFLSFARFHFMGAHRQKFADRILAEMMAPVSGDGDNAFWDAFGRKFIPVRYAEADRFCQHNRKFIYELLPKEEIYLTLLPLEVINTVAVVSRETLPARRLLESLGFKYRGFIDPFDGGPHLDAPTNEVPLVKNTHVASAVASTTMSNCKAACMVSVLLPEGEFRAVETWAEPASIAGLPKANASVKLLPQTFEVLGVEPGTRLTITPMGKWGPQAEDAPHLSVTTAAVPESSTRTADKGSKRTKPAPKVSSKMTTKGGKGKRVKR